MDRYEHTIGQSSARPWRAGMAGFAVGHLLSLVILLLGWQWQRLQDADPVFATVTFKQFLTSWDGGWYLRIVDSGYPAELPVDSAGEVMQNAWAFFPGFPLLVRALSGPVSADPAIVGLAINQLAVISAAALLIDLVRRLGWADSASAYTLALFMMPAAPVLWMLYSEALFLALTLLVLDLLVANRYWGALAAAPFAVVTRGAGVAVAATVAAVIARRWWLRSKSGESNWTDAAAAAAAGLLVVFSVAFWPLTAYLVTGRTDTLPLTYDAWNVGPSYGFDWLPFFQTPYEFIAVMAVMMSVTVIWGARDRLDEPLIAFSVFYLGFLLATSSPHSSTVRYLLPLVTVPLALGRRALMPSLLAMAVVAEFWWVFDLVVASGFGESPP